MSMQVPIDQIEASAAEYGSAAYVLVSDDGAPPRVMHSPVSFEGSTIIVSVGRSAAAALTTNPTLSLLWPADASQSMSLIVDARVLGSVDTEGGEIRVEPTGAVRHRPASG